MSSDNYTQVCQCPAKVYYNGHCAIDSTKCMHRKEDGSLLESARRCLLGLGLLKLIGGLKQEAVTIR